MTSSTAIAVEAYANLCKHFSRLYRLEHLNAVAEWDALVNMPPGGAEARGAAVAELAKLIHEGVTDPKLRQWIEDAKKGVALDATAFSRVEKGNLREIERRWVIENKLPSDLVEQIKLAESRAEAAWRVCRANNDWETFKPHMSTIMSLLKKKGELLAEGTGRHPYEALMDLHEPGAKLADVKALFDNIKTWLPKLLQDAIALQDSKGPIISPVGPFPLDKQEVLYETVYPQNKWQFIRRFVMTMLVRTPLGLAVAAMAVQHVSCDFSSLSGGGLSSRELLLGGLAEQSAVGDRVGTLALGSLREYSPELHFIGLVTVARVLTAVVCHAFYLYVEKHDLLARYKIPRAPQTIPSEELRNDSIKGYLLEFITTPVALYGLITLGVIRQVEDVCKPISLLPAMLFIIACLFANETGFYWAHRILHEFPYLYRTIHKKHHKYIGSISVAAEYAHPLESAFSSSLPLISTIIVWPASPILFSLWVAFRLVETCESHSGYCFNGSMLSQRFNLTFSTNCLFHDFHHTANKGNYGQGGVFWDYICGTDRLYRSKIAAAVAQRKSC